MSYRDWPPNTLRQLKLRSDSSARLQVTTRVIPFWYVSLLLFGTSRWVWDAIRMSCRCSDRSCSSSVEPSSTEMLRSWHIHERHHQQPLLPSGAAVAEPGDSGSDGDDGEDDDDDGSSDRLYLKVMSYIVHIALLCNLLVSANQHFGCLYPAIYMVNIFRDFCYKINAHKVGLHVGGKICCRWKRLANSPHMPKRTRSC